MKDSKKNRKAPKQTKSKWTALDNEIAELKEKYDQISAKDIKSFKDVPLSLKTQQGLVNGKYENPTEIQKESIILALKGNDILGAAKTGSGKTLAFLIPVIECLFRVKWTPLDGLGALIISPTRELAYQIFEVLRVVGKRHDFSAGLVIGGKHLREEASRINKTNIVICTPGRLLQHMDETVNFNADNLQVLVLDEADRILDMGFQESVNAIIENLPATRQTLLFSATQTKSIKDLARLSLKDPVYVSVHENAKHSTPTQLQQSYILCELHEKLNILWSFVRNHLKNKILVFMATCKQVRYVSEVFKKLSPGITILGLHGSMQQLKRVATYESFCRKQHAVLFATDLAARGLDFPAVNWVVQMDCPEDANTYIHRAGRTARYETNGESLLILQPSEEKMIEELDHKKIPIDKISVNTKKMFSIQSNLESLCAAEVQVKEFAQRAFVAYLKSVFFMKNKAIFDVSKLDTNSFSRSLGLAMPPRIRFLKKALDAKKTKPDSKKMEKNISESDPDKDTFHSASEKVDESAEEEESSSSDSDDDIAREGNKSLSSEVFNFNVEDEEDNSDVLLVKSKTVTSEESDKDDDVDEETGVKGKTKTKVAVAKKILKKKLKVNTKTVFNEDGEEIIDVHKKVLQVEDESSDENVEGINLSEAKQRMEEVDKFDKALFRQKIKDRKKEKKMKLKERRKAEIEEAKDESEEDAAFVVGGAESDGFNSEDEDRFNTAEEGSGDYSEENQSSSMSTGDVSSEEESSGSIDSEEFQQQKNRPLKRKSKASQNLQGLKRKRKAADDEDFNTGLSLQDDEELALKLLTNS